MSSDVRLVFAVDSFGARTDNERWHCITHVLFVLNACMQTHVTMPPLLPIWGYSVLVNFHTWFHCRHAGRVVYRVCIGKGTHQNWHYVIHILLKICTVVSLLMQNLMWSLDIFWKLCNTIVGNGIKGSIVVYSTWCAIKYHILGIFSVFVNWTVCVCVSYLLQ